MRRANGVREIGKPARVDERTIFAIGSSSKAFTSAAVAMLVDSGKVSLDAPASAYLPGFQLYDNYATREITVRDLLSHRSGLARGELIWYGSDNDRDEILRRVRYLPPTWSFRSQFGYQNIMYLAAGQVVAKVTGASWDDFIKRRIFQPLGMTSSSTSVTALQGIEDLATPHATGERHRPGHPVPQDRQHRSGGRHQLQRRRHGAMGAPPPGRRQVRRQAADQQTDDRRDALGPDGHQGRSDVERHEPLGAPHGVRARLVPERLRGQVPRAARRKHRRHDGAGRHGARGEVRQSSSSRT
jgi:CubicO group peptidase (beta-lactamase class C family)